MSKNKRPDKPQDNPPAKADSAGVDNAASNRNSASNSELQPTEWKTFFLFRFISRKWGAFSALELPQQCEIATSILGTLLAFGGLALLYRQTGLMNTQTALTEQQAELTRISNEINYAVQKPILRLSTVKADSVPFSGREYFGVILYSVWENAGATDAVDVIGFFDYGYELTSGPTTEQFIGTGRITRPKLSPGIATPRVPFNIGYRPQSEKQFFGLELPRQGRRVTIPVMDLRSRSIIAFGWVAYRDDLVASNRHVRGFCRQLYSVEFSAAEPRYMWANCMEGAGSRYNCADKRCPGYEFIVAYLP